MIVIHPIGKPLDETAIICKCHKNARKSNLSFAPTGDIHSIKNQFKDRWTIPEWFEETVNKMCEEKEKNKVGSLCF